MGDYELPSITGREYYLKGAPKIPRYDLDIGAFFKAVHARDASEVRHLVEEGLDVDVRDAIGSTALMWACTTGDIDIVKFLIENGANINLKTNFGETALMGAAFYGKSSIVELLLKNDADITIVSSNGNTAMDYARTMNNFNIAKTIESYHSGENNGEL